MNVLDVILIGVALSMDAAALTVANCATYRTGLTTRKKWAMPIFFAVFQGIMPLIGYLVGWVFADMLSKISGYLVSAIFLFLAIKILIDYIKESKQSETCGEEQQKQLTYKLLLLQAVLTSIDALAVGVTLGLELAFSVYFAVLIIAGVTFAIVSIALVLGDSIGKAFGKYSSVFGFIILLTLAIKTFIEAVV